VNSTLSGNSAAGTGGAIYNNPGNARVSNSTITLNTAGIGSGILGNAILESSIVAANVNNSTIADVAGTFVSNGYNLIGNVGTASGITGPGDQKGSGANPIDPQLGGLQDNGGPTPTHKPAAGFPGHDKGCAFGAETDQRGFARTIDWPSVADGSCTGLEGTVGSSTDIGAVELLGATAAPASISGRVSQQNGRGIENVVIEAWDTQGNVVASVRTNSFGYFTLSEMPSGADYIVTASAKRYRFEQASFVVSLRDNVDGLKFVGVTGARQ
jgi:hypothetical protein